MSEANIDRLHEEIFELKQDIEEYERRLSVSNETIDIYEKLVKHVETQRDGLYQELQSNEMLINELEQQKAELMEFISSKLSEAWSKMGDTGSSDYMSKLNDENYWFGYFSALDNAQDTLNKYKQQEERDE